MKRILTALLLAPIALAQVQTIPNTTFPAVRTILNSNFSWLNTNKASTSATLTLNGVTITLGTANSITSTNITEGTNLYFTNARTLSAMAGLYESPLTFNSSHFTRATNTISLKDCANDGYVWKWRSSGGWGCEADQTGAAGGGITSLNTLNGADQTFSRTNDTNVTLTLTPSGADHNFALGWTGTLAIARGGTGAATTSQNYVFIGPTSGSGAPSFRALVAGDIPTLNQSTTGNAATATALAANPAACSAGQYVSDIAADGTLTCSAPGGSGTVTVVASGALTSTALVTGGGTTTLQTPAATATMDSSGNISTPGTVTATSFITAAGSVAGLAALPQGTANTPPANTVGFQAPTSVPTAFLFTLPSAPAAGYVKATNANPSVISVGAIAAADLPAALANSTSVNGTAIGASKTILYTDTAAGSFPTLNQNTSGTAANLSGTPALPNGTTATTQTAADNTTKLATTAYADAAAAARAAVNANTTGTAGGLTGTALGGDVTNSGNTVTVTKLNGRTLTLAHGCAVGDPAGSALATGVLCYIVVPTAGTITGWDIITDAGTATVDVWKIATGTAKPTVANTITASAKPAIASGTAIHSTTLTGWTTSVAANDIIGFNLDAVATAKYITVNLQIAH